MYDQITVKLKKAADGSGASARLARYIIESSGKIGQVTVSELADESGVSYATVCRFTRALGFERFGELKKAVERSARELSARLPTSDTPSETQPDAVIRSVCELSESITASCRSSIKPAMLEELCRLLMNARRVYFIGLGTSAVTASYARIKLFRLGINCSSDTDIILMKMNISLMKPGDLLCAISSSGRTKSIIETARLARESGITVISFCDYSNSPLSKNSDLCVTTTSRDASVNPLADLPLIQGQLTIIDIIYSRLYSRIGGIGFDRTKQSVLDEKELSQK